MGGDGREVFRLQQWPAGQVAGERKLRLLNDRFIGLAIDQLALLQS